MLGQLAGQHEAHGGLHLARRHRRLLRVAAELGRFLRNGVSLEGATSGKLARNGPPLGARRGTSGPPLGHVDAVTRGRDAVEDVVDEGVHDGHALLGDARVRVHLLEDAVDVPVRVPPRRTAAPRTIRRGSRGVRLDLLALLTGALAGLCVGEAHQSPVAWVPADAGKRS